MLGRSDIKPTPEKLCAVCGKPFQRKRFRNGRLEDFQAFNRRRYCSLSCANSRSKGGNSRTRCHAAARMHLKSCCESCGSTEKLHVHHCDENWQNNSVENLQTLCESCHRSWHATLRSAGVFPVGRKPVLQVSPSPSRLPVAWDDCAPTAMQSSHRSRKSSLRST